MSPWSRSRTAPASSSSRAARTSGRATSSARTSSKQARHPESDIFLDDITVSRRHVEISPKDGAYWVRDVGSLNGTYVNRERIDEVPLAPGDEVQIGKFKLVYLVAGNE